MIKDLKGQLFKLLSEYYNAIGLIPDLKHSTFDDESRSVYWYPFQKYSDSISYQPKITLRFPKVQQIQESIFTNQSNFTIQRPTGRRIVEELGLVNHGYIFQSKYLIEDRSHLYILKNGVDSEDIFQDHKLFMEEIGLCLFRDLDSLSKIDDFINKMILSKPLNLFSTEEISSLRRKSLKQEVIAGIISSYLLDNLRGEDLLSRYEKIYEGNNFVLKDFAKLKAYFQSDPT